jgi:hypothetical protein
MSIQLATEEVRARAYELWETRGRLLGTPDEDWYAAREQLERELDAVSSPLEPLASKAADVLEDDAGVRARPTRTPKPAARKRGV